MTASRPFLRFLAYLTSDDLTLDGVKQLMCSDFSCVDKVNLEHECPLLTVLKNKKCSADIIKHLLQFNSGINCRDRHGNSCLCVALKFSREEAIVKALMENGADVNSADEMGRPLLCIAMQYGAPNNIVKLLLDKGSSHNKCKYHGSLMNCVLHNVKELTEDFLNLLISAGADLTEVEDEGCSPLCLALIRRLDVKKIELLISKGCSLDACQMHDSPMLCATASTIGPPLTADVVQLLLKNDAAMDKKSSIVIRGYYGSFACNESLTPLQCALRRIPYETEAIKLMVDHPSFDASDTYEERGNLLHLAVGNPHCKLSAVQLLIDRGVEVGKVNKRGQTPLEVALINNQTSRNPGIVELLIKHGCPAERFPETHLTAMRLAVTRNMDGYILKMLFAAGASVELLRKYGNTSLLRLAFDDYKSEPSQMKLDRVKLLLKFSFLENHNFNIQWVGMNPNERSEIVRFADECRIEMYRLGLYDLGYDHTLLDFASLHRFPPNCVSKYNSTVINYDLNELLQILSKNVFPVFFDIILSKLGRESLENKLEDTPVFITKNYSGPSRAVKHILLNYHCVSSITKNLSDLDLINFILAFNG